MNEAYKGGESVACPIDKTALRALQSPNNTPMRSSKRGSESAQLALAPRGRGEEAFVTRSDLMHLLKAVQQGHEEPAITLLPPKARRSDSSEVLALMDNARSGRNAVPALGPERAAGACAGVPPSLMATPAPGARCPVASPPPDGAGAQVPTAAPGADGGDDAESAPLAPGSARSISLATAPAAGETGKHAAPPKKSVAEATMAILAAVQSKDSRKAAEAAKAAASAAADKGAATRTGAAKSAKGATGSAGEPAAAPTAVRKRPASASLAGTPLAKAGKKSPGEKAYDRAYEKVKKYWLSQGKSDTVAKEFAKEAAKIARAKARAC